MKQLYVTYWKHYAFYCMAVVSQFHNGLCHGKLRNVWAQSELILFRVQNGTTLSQSLRLPLWCLSVFFLPSWSLLRTLYALHLQRLEWKNISILRRVLWGMGRKALHRSHHNILVVEGHKCPPMYNKFPSPKEASGGLNSSAELSRAVSLLCQRCRIGLLEHFKCY